MKIRQEEIKYKLKQGSHAIMQFKHLSFRLLSKNLKIKICKTIILAFMLYGYEA
jgi:hypothetical protein